METRETEFIVMSSCAKMPTSCWGRYRNLAILEVVKGTFPKMISERARGVVDIRHYWGKLHDGKTNRSAFGRALEKAEKIAAELNAARAARKDD